MTHVKSDQLVDTNLLGASKSTQVVRFLGLLFVRLRSLDWSLRFAAVIRYVKTLISPDRDVATGGILITGLGRSILLL
jgi:hypothetical protein